MSLGPIFLIILVDLLAMTLMIPLLPFYAQKFGASAVEVGLLGSSFAACQLLASPILGRLSDRYGRKRILVLSQIGTCAGLLMMVGAKALWVLFVARMIDGFTAGNIPLAQAYIADHSDPKDRAKNFGLIGVAFGLGLILGPAISGWLSVYDWNYPIYAGAAFSFLSVVTTLILLPADGPASKEGTSGLTGFWVFVDFWKRQELRPWLLGFLLFVFAFNWFGQGLALFAQGRLGFGPKEVGFWLAYCGVLGVIIQGFLIGPLVNRFGEAKLVRAGFLLDTVGYAGLAMVTSIPALLAASTLFAMGNSCLRPALTGLVSRNAAKNEQGAVLGLTASLNSVGQIAAPPLGNSFIEAGILSGWGFGLAGLCLLGFLLPRPSKR